MKRHFPPRTNFRSLSILDLLQAREAYHAHLINKDNVIATALGLYRIRKDDPDINKFVDYDNAKQASRDTPRTLQNTEVKPWSWPCLLVFVNKWLRKTELENLSKSEPDQVVPRFLYLPDGRIIPTCVIYSEEIEESPAPLHDLNFPHELIGGGYPVFTEEQGEQRVGSVACMVSDGNSTFALTNRHVTGEENAEICSYLGSDRTVIGISHKKQLGKKLFSDVYPGWPGSHAYCNIDAGLIYINDVRYWTAQIFGIGEIDKPVDLNTHSISLDLIGCPVRAFGSASGDLRGEVKALFYRYKSIGGIEYISDLLIGSRDDSDALKTRPGDSGTLWVYDEETSAIESRKKGLSGERARRLRPLALQWGGHVLKGNSHAVRFPYALATFFSTICRELDVDVIPNWNIGHSEYWGKTGHYKIAAKACELVTDTKLKKLLLANTDTIAFDDDAIKEGELKKIDAKQFVPLADVPDLVWRTYRKKDAVNHFADMDEKATKGDFKGKTLLDICKDTDSVDVQVWNQFYESIGVDTRNRGALPFRVWQIFDSMVEFVKSGKIAEYICAGGVLSHYVADACQPLHISRLHHGESPEEKPVHSKYENDILDRNIVDIIAQVNAELKGVKAKKNIKSGRDAAIATVDLMRSTIKKLPPEKIIEVFNANTGRERIPAMYKAVGKQTVSCMVDGCILLASIWDSTWALGEGTKTAATKLKSIERTKLKTIYNDRSFIPAYYLTDVDLQKILQK